MFSNFSKIVAVIAIASAVTACSGKNDDMNGTTSSGNTVSGNNSGQQIIGGNNGSISQDSLSYFNQEIGDRVFFGTDQHTLSSDAQSRLAAQIAWIKQYAPSNMITIEGHADERGTREYNIALGARRAASVRSFIVSQGIPQSKINAVSFGKERPEVDGSNQSAWAKNRRAVTVIN